MKISFTAPYPPTTNKIWRNFGGRMVLSQEARDYKEAVALAALNSGWEFVENLVPCFQDHDLMGVTLHVYRPRKSRDIDNCAKLILDAMQGVTYGNDNQIIELHIYRHDDKLNPRVEVEVIGLATIAPKTTRKKASVKNA